MWSINNLFKFQASHTKFFINSLHYLYKTRYNPKDYLFMPVKNHKINPVHNILNLNTTNS